VNKWHLGFYALLSSRWMSTPEGHEQRPMERSEAPPVPLLGCGSIAALLVWGLAILAVTAGIAGETVLWPLVPFFGAALPTLLVVLRHRDGRGALAARLPPLPPPGDPAVDVSEGDPEGPRGRPVPLEDPLSEREREVLGLLAAGKTNREVAAELYIAEGTVKAHVAGIYRKLAVHSRAEAVSKAADQNLL
jgi:DNA-binding CsgD family transcriptional regulator